MEEVKSSGDKGHEADKSGSVDLAVQLAGSPSSLKARFPNATQEEVRRLQHAAFNPVAFPFPEHGETA
jgi:hypothetical protein